MTENTSQSETAVKSGFAVSELTPKMLNPYFDEELIKE
jgi:hypothetical protein